MLFSKLNEKEANSLYYSFISKKN